MTDKQTTEQENELLALRWAVKLMGFDPQKLVKAADSTSFHEARLLSHVHLDEAALLRDVGATSNISAWRSIWNTLRLPDKTEPPMTDKQTTRKLVQTAPSIPRT